MPLYEYKCAKCGHRFEKIEKVSAPSRQKCPKCKSMARRLQSAPAIQFKGSGWYVTDYGRMTPGGDATREKSDKPAEGAKDSKESKEKSEKKQPAKKESKK